MGASFTLEPFVVGQIPHGQPRVLQLAPGGPYRSHHQMQLCSRSSPPGFYCLPNDDVCKCQTASKANDAPQMFLLIKRLNESGSSQISFASCDNSHCWSPSDEVVN